MLVDISQACNELPNSMSPLPPRMVARDSAAAAAMNAAVVSANANETASWVRSPWDFRSFGLNFMSDVWNSNRNNPGSAGVLASLAKAGLLPPAAAPPPTRGPNGASGGAPTAFGPGYGGGGNPGLVRTAGGQMRARWRGRSGGDRLFGGGGVRPVFGKDFTGRGYGPGGGPAGDDGNGGTIDGAADGRVCLPQPPAVTTLPLNGPDGNYVPMVSPNVPSPTIAPMPPMIIPPKPGCTAKPSGNICLDLRNGVILASQVPAAVLYRCSQLGYVGNCPACGDGSGGAVNVDQAALNALQTINATTLGPCPQLGLGDSYQGPYPIGCAPPDATAAAAALSSISPWWWVLAGGVLVLIMGSSDEKMPRAQRRRARARRAA